MCVYIISYLAKVDSIFQISRKLKYILAIIFVSTATETAHCVHAYNNRRHIKLLYLKMDFFT